MQSCHSREMLNKKSLHIDDKPKTTATQFLLKNSIL